MRFCEESETSDTFSVLSDVLSDVLLVVLLDDWFVIRFEDWLFVVFVARLPALSFVILFFPVLFLDIRYLLFPEHRNISGNGL